jgi:hypothetical protein
VENSARSLGWLRFLDRALAGSAPRLDPLSTALAAGLLAQRTPAWTERSVAAVDRLIRAGPAPDAVGTGPDWWRSALATSLVVYGIRSMIGGDAPAGRDHAVEGGERRADPVGAHRDLAVRLGRAWREHLPPDVGIIDATSGAAAGQLSLAGLGLHLHDHHFGGNLYAELFRPWWTRVRPAVLHAAADPDAAAAIMRTALHLAPSAPDDARRLFDAAWVNAGRADAGTDLEVAAIGLLLAREWGLRDTAERLAEQLEQACAPSWDDERGEFTWGAGSAEALLAAAEATGEGGWSALTTNHSSAAAQVRDVEFPTLGLRRAEWSNGFLTLGLDPLQEDRGARTTFRLIGAEPRVWWVSGAPDITVEMSARAVTVRVPMVAATIEFAPSSY